MNDEKNLEKQFRTVFGGGYQKSDVNEYIASMHAEFISVENTLKNTINHQKEQITQLQNVSVSLKAKEHEATEWRQAAETAEAALAETKIEARDAKDALEGAREAIAAAQKETAAQKERADALAAELLILRQELEDARSAQENESELPVPVVQQYPEDYELLKQKAEQYDKMSAQIGTVMLKADANADTIVKNARAEAEKLLNGINAELAVTRSKAKGAADTLIGEINGRVREINSICCDDIMTDLEQIRGTLGSMVVAVEDTYAKINQKLDNARCEMESSARSAIYQAAAPRVLKNSQEKE